MLTLWFSGVLPKQIAKITANNYMSHQENGEEYEFDYIEYSSVHDSYFAYYTIEGNEKKRVIEIWNTYFFFGVRYDNFLGLV